MPTLVPATPSRSDAAYRATVNAWALYDWANSTFATTVIAAVLPVYYGSLTRAAGVSADDSNAYWAYTNTIYLALVALAGPVLGTLADVMRGKKRFLAVFVALGSAATAGLFWLGPDSYRLASALFIVGGIGFAGGNIFYESLLPHIAREGDLDRVSSRGYAFGYVGGGLLLLLNLLWIARPESFGLPDKSAAVRCSFLSVAVWWAGFSIPLFRRVPEPQGGTGLGPRGLGAVVRASFRQLADTLRHLREHRQLLLFLVAFWIYNDGIGTVIKMATKYGESLGLNSSDLILALVITQFVGFPCALGFGWLAGRFGTKRSILLGLGVYVVISVLGFFMKTNTEFYLLAILVGTVQGGTQALSRSLFAGMVPRDRSAEFFGFYSTGAKFAGILGPLVFGIMAQHFGSRWSILSVSAFFIVGALLLWRVDERKGP